MFSKIISEFHLFEIEDKSLWRNSMVLDQALFGISPKSLQTINVNSIPAETFTVVDFQMAVATAHQGIIASELIGVNDRSSFHGFDRQIQQAFRRNIRKDFDLDLSLSLQDSKDWDFPGSSSASFTFSFASEIGFIELDFSSELTKVPGISQDAHTDQVRGLEGCGIANLQLSGNAQTGNFQFKELEDPQPLFGPEVELTDPAAGKICEGITTVCASVAFAFELIDPFGLTTNARATPLRPNFSCEVESSLILTANNKFKAFEVHGTSLNGLILVPNHL